MIEILKERCFHLQTKNTSYIFSIQQSMYAEHIYYGKKLKDIEASLLAIREKHLIAPCFSTVANRENPEQSLDDTLLEFSTEGKGDYRTPLVAISAGDNGERTLDLKFEGYEIYKGIKRFTTLTLAQAIATDMEADTLELCFRDKAKKIALHLFYTVFPETDTITRRSVIVNESDQKIALRSLFSCQLDIRAKDMDLISFPGQWARERHMQKQHMQQNTYVIESRGLDSSADANPAFIITNEKDTYLFNLIYSGPHRASITQTTRGITHILWGINPDMFSWPLEKQESFESPEAVMIYSDKGLDGVRDLSHQFVIKYIRRGNWKGRMKPLMFNTWEGSYFNINETKLSIIVKNAKEMGMEGIVIDDGWFGARKDDTTSLGDWFVDSMKFPSGLADISNLVHHNGMLFGLWIEPECVSEKSALAKRHPEWIIGRDVRKNAEGRHQQLLDLSNPEVQEWIINTITRLVDTSHIDYIKWDMNRRYSDLYTQMDIKDYGTYAHRYISGLYTILRTINLQFPNLYIEGCASGGARFDLGILSYCSSIWTSDCSDPVERLAITEGTSMVYPLSVMGVSVAPTPNAATRRRMNLDARFESALFGVLSYSVDGISIDKNTMNSYIKQVDFYKNYRALFQFGRFRVQESENRTIWTISNPDASLIMVLYFQKENRINTTVEKLFVECANEDYLYKFYPRERSSVEISKDKIYKLEPECYTVSGSALKWAGISLYEQYSGNGYADGMRVIGDFNTRLYILKKVN